ncbi:MAG: hypothetical protein QOG30_1898 [Acidimicrobiaceae bacterium]
MDQVEPSARERDDAGVSVVVRSRPMQLSPRYDGPPVFAFEGAADDQREPVLRQRRRLQDTLATLTDEQWTRPSRCEGWSVQDVIAHLIGTNNFWSLSILAGLAGSPTRILAAFDPAATPALMVEPMRSMSASETLDQFVESNQALYDAIESLDIDGWSTVAESPAGHVPIRLLASHALWDAWVHERDIMLPLDLIPAQEPDEIASCLRYVTAVAPVLAFSSDPTRRGALEIDATEPDVHVVIEVDTTVVVRDGPAPAGAIRLTGRATDLVDSLSIRAPLHHTVPAHSRWLIEGLATVFDVQVESV